MSRQRAKGTQFESQVVDFLNARFGGERTFHRLGMGGTNDMGDVWGLFSHGRPVVVECKNCKRPEWAEWLGEAERERGNADALASVVVIKRRGVGPRSMGRTYVLTTLEDMVAMLTGEREEG